MFHVRLNATFNFMIYERKTEYEKGKYIRILGLDVVEFEISAIYNPYITVAVILAGVNK